MCRKERPMSRGRSSRVNSTKQEQHATRIPGKACLNQVARKSAKLAIRLQSITFRNDWSENATGSAFVLRRETQLYTRRVKGITELNLTRSHTSSTSVLSMDRMQTVLTLLRTKRHKHTGYSPWKRNARRWRIIQIFEFIVKNSGHIRDMTIVVIYFQFYVCRINSRIAINPLAF